MLAQIRMLFPTIIAIVIVIGPIPAIASRDLKLHQGTSCIPTRDAVFRNNDYYASWTANLTSQTIQFRVLAGTTGYVGFGLSRFTGMTGSDIVIGGVFPNGTVYFADYFATNNANPPQLDPSQDWFLDSAIENGTHTELIFHRAFDTLDVQNDYVIDDSLTTIIWAIGSSDTLFSHGSSNRNMYLASILHFPGCSVLPQREEILNERYIVRWSVDPEARTVEFHVIAENTGYVGFGLSYAGSTMFIADLAIGGVYENGTEFFGDYSGIGFTTPVRDDSQDWFLIEAQQNGTHTELKFWRNFDTGDFDQDSPITTNPVHLLWALGLSDNIGYHFGDRGSKEVTLMEPIDCVP